MELTLEQYLYAKYKAADDMVTKLVKIIASIEHNAKSAQEWIAGIDVSVQSNKVQTAIHNADVLLNSILGEVKELEKKKKYKN